MTTAPARTFEVRHVQLARAAFAALAAVMVTFSPDHSAAVGLSIFSGFVVATGIVLLVSAWLVHTAGTRWPSILLGTISVIAGLASGAAPLRSVTTFFVVVIAWALLTGLIETIVGARGLGAARRQQTSDAARGEFRDALTTGILTLALGAGLLLVPTQYALRYTVEDAGDFTLTGIIIGVGIFGGYAAIVAVYLGIAGFSPRRAAAVPSADAGGEVAADAVTAPRVSADGERGTA